VTIPLEPAVAYRLWASTYDTENVVTTLEDRLVRTISPSHERRVLLDVACGTGRRLPHSDGSDTPRASLGIDLVFEMVARAHSRGHTMVAAADMRALPCRADSFDLIWCRLAIGHVRDVTPAYREFARVACNGASIIVTDFHPAAAKAGHSRTFRDVQGALHDVEHHVHSLAAHRDAAAAVGLELTQYVEGAVDPSIREHYERAGRLDLYERQIGLPLVLALEFNA
jgi:malonyl-CoA O-methyltransferase